MTDLSDIKSTLLTSVGSGKMVVIGLGNPDRSDDGIGLEIAKQLQLKYPKQAFLETEKAVEGLILEALENESITTVLFVDATDFGGSPGDLSLFNITDANKFVPAFSTHKVPITLLMGLIAQQNRTPFLLGIQPYSLEFLGEMSPVVLAAAEKLSTLLDPCLSQ